MSVAAVPWTMGQGLGEAFGKEMRWVREACWGWGWGWGAPVRTAVVHLHHILYVVYRVRVLGGVNGRACIQVLCVRVCVCV